MRVVLVFAVLLVTSSAFAAPGEQCANSVSGWVGARFVDEDEIFGSFAPDLGTGRELGVMTTWCGKSWPIQIAVDLSRDNKPGDQRPFRENLTTYEADIGVRYQWRRHAIQP